MGHFHALDRGSRHVGRHADHGRHADEGFLDHARQPVPGLTFAGAAHQHESDLPRLDAAHLPLLKGEIGQCESPVATDEYVERIGYGGANLRTGLPFRQRHQRVPHLLAGTVEILLHNRLGEHPPDVGSLEGSAGVVQSGRLDHHQHAGRQQFRHGLVSNLGRGRSTYARDEQYETERNGSMHDKSPLHFGHDSTRQGRTPDDGQRRQIHSTHCRAACQVSI